MRISDWSSDVCSSDLLDAGDQNAGFGGLVHEFGSLGVNGRLQVSSDGTPFVDRFTDDVQDAAKRLGTYRHGNLRTRVTDFLTAGQAVGAVHGNGADSVLAKMLSHFKNQTLAVIVGFERRQNGGQTVREGDVDDSADDLADLANNVGAG